MIQRRIDSPNALIRPEDHGRRMPLAQFDRAEGQEGYLYELNRGVIEVINVPGEPHLAQVDALRVQLYAFRQAHPEVIHRIAGTMECKVLLTDLESERHPDLAIYKTARPRARDLWARWIPAIVVEVVSPGSKTRDYEDKRADYFQFGVSEYWIFIAARRELLVLQRGSGRWRAKRLEPPALYRTRQLPGFVLDCGAVFAAAGTGGE